MRIGSSGLLLLVSTLFLPLSGCASVELDQWQAEVDSESDETDVTRVWINDRACSTPLHSTWNRRGILRPRMTTGVQVGRIAADGRDWDIFIVGVVDIMPYYPITPEYNEICDVRIIARTGEGDARRWHRSEFDMQAVEQVKEHGRFVMGSFITRADKWSLTQEGSRITMKEQVSDAEFAIDLPRAGS